MVKMDCKSLKSLGFCHILRYCINAKNVTIFSVYGDLRGFTGVYVSYTYAVFSVVY